VDIFGIKAISENGKTLCFYVIKVNSKFKSYQDDIKQY